VTKSLARPAFEKHREHMWGTHSDNEGYGLLEIMFYS
jgi:hypothetical protein